MDEKIIRTHCQPEQEMLVITLYCAEGKHLTSAVIVVRLYLHIYSEMADFQFL